MQGPRADVLLVEDDANDVVVALRAFRRHSLEARVRVLHDGAELVDYLQLHDLRRHLPKLILLDLKMPRMDGRTALRELRSRSATRHVPVVVVSSSDRPSDVRECYELGANSFVVKEINPSSPGTYLVDTIRYWLDRNQTTS
jgi:two-component system, response regulator